MKHSEVMADGSANVRERSGLRRLLADRRAVSAIEFALIAPLIILLMLVGFEGGRLYLANQRVSGAATRTADMVTNARKITPSEARSVMAAARHIIGRFDYDAGGMIVVSAIAPNTSGTPVVVWQEREGALQEQSRIGSAGGAAALPAGFTMSDRETAISVEVFLQHTALIKNILPPITMYEVSFFRPRISEVPVK